MVAIIFAVIITCQSQSFKDKRDHNTNVIGSFVVLMTSYSFLVFNVLSVEQNFDFGYVTIGIISIYFLFSIAQVVINSLVQSKKSLRMMLFKRRYAYTRSIDQILLKRNH